VDAARVVRVRDGLRRRPLSADSIAVFDSRSWRTHVVSGAAAMLLTLFSERGGQPADSLVDALELVDAGLSRAEAQMLVDRALVELAQCALVEGVDLPSTH